MNGKDQPARDLPDQRSPRSPLERALDGGVRAGEPAAARVTHAWEGQRFVLRLYVTGLTRRSSQAIEQVRSLCEQYLHGRYELEVFDIHQLPSLARDEQIVATPTLIKVLPAPLRRCIGNFTKVETVLLGLDLRESPR